MNFYHYHGHKINKRQTESVDKGLSGGLSSLTPSTYRKKIIYSQEVVYECEPTPAEMSPSLPHCVTVVFYYFGV